MIKRILFSAFVAAISLSAFAQRTCLSTEVTEKLRTADAAYDNEMKVSEDVLRKWVATGQQDPNFAARAVRTIPVVVHVIYNTGAQNVSNAAIQQMIAQMNLDYTKANTDLNSARSVVQPLAANAQIQFCLAQQDPSGNATTGIERLSTTKTCWDPNTESDKMKSTTTGGLNTWDRRYYLNVWIVSLCGNTQFSGIGGYAYVATASALPTASIDGVVIDYYWGMMSGHTWSHEVGHYLGLHHTWGDLSSNACGNVFPDTDDGFSDTPDSKAANFGCTPLVSCTGNSAYGDLLEDFMDYSDCPVLFTTQQANYMNSVLSGSRALLTTTNVCSTTGAPIANFTGSPTTICTGQTVTFTNTSTGSGNTYSWTFAGGTPSTSTATNPTVTYNTAGTYTVTLVATNTNGNNTKTQTGYITVSGSNALPLTEGFDATTFPPTGWALNNVDASTTWARTTSASGFGTSAASAYVNNYSYNAAGQKDWLITPSYNFTGVSSGRIKWDYAYAPYTTAGYSDSLEVLYSTNCGVTWTSLWKKGGSQLGTATATGNNFVPTAAQWKKDSVSLAAISGQTNVRFAFKNACQYGNNVFLDNVNIYNASAQTGSAPVADFVGTPTTVVVGNTVAFTDLSTNTPTSWAWTFAGGTPGTSTAQNPTITYSTVGTYSVTLTATNTNGGNPITKTNYITVIQSGGGTQSCDTLSNIFAADTLTLYNFTGTASGYLSGHNSYNDKAKAEYYVNPTPGAKVTGGMFYFGHAETLNPGTASITAKVWDATGTNAVNGAPGNVLASQTVLINTIVTDVVNQDLTYVSFPTQPTVNGNFYIGFEMTYANGDSIAIVTTTFNSPSGGKGWEQWSDNSWWPYDSSFGNGTSNVILPILCTTSTGSAPTASFTANNTAVCVGSTVNFTSTTTGSPTSYSWTFTGGTPTGSSAQNPSVVYNTAGTYAVALTASNGNGSNTSTQNSFITVYAKPTLTTNATPVLCYGGSTGSASVTAVGGTPNYTFSWSGGGTAFNITNKVAGTYTVTVSDAHQCSSTASVNITQPLSALSASGSANDAACGQANGSATVTATGGAGNYTYLWNTSATIQTLSNINPATYTVTVTDANACTVTTSATVSNATSNFAVSIDATNASCGQSNGSAVALPNNPTGVTYHWSNNSSAGSITGLAAGTYSVTVTNPTGCTASASATITNVASNMVVTFSITQTACGQSTGGATATVTGGTSPYTYHWSTNVTTNSISNVAAGGYPLTVTDNGGCSVVNTASISNTGGPTATATPTSPTCFGGTNGSATVSATGGTQPYTYSWSSGGTATSVTGLGAGTYTVSVHDNAQCLAVQTVTITNPAAINVSITTTNALCGNQNGTAIAVATGGSGTYTYFWNNGNTTVSNIDLGAGSFTVTVTDNNQCTSMATAQVGSSAAPTSVLNAINGTCQITPQINLTILGGTQPFTFVWSNGATSQNLTGITAGSYTVTITDANGCKSISSTSVTDNSSVNVTFNSQNPTTGNSDGSITANPNGGTSPYTYSWSTGSTSATVSNLPAGTYTVTITDQTGCVRISSVILSSPSSIAQVTDIALIKVYPNPAHDVCNIQLELNKAQSLEIKMYNNIGQQVWAKSLSGFKQGTETVDVSRLAAGVYMVQIQVNGSMQIIKFVKE